MKTTKKIGNEAEESACSFLRQKGIKIIERNWHYGKYEVDIIAEDKNDIIFIEVKFRSNLSYGDPELFVSLKQRLHLIRAANAYISQKNISKNARFDIIGVIKNGNKLGINHIEDAFKPEVNQD